MDNMIINGNNVLELPEISRKVLLQIESLSKKKED